METIIEVKGEMDVIKAYKSRPVYLIIIGAFH